MTILKYLVFLGALYSAATHLPGLWARYKLGRTIEQTGGIKAFAIPENCRGKKYCITTYIAPWNADSTYSDITFYAFHKFLPRLRPQVGFGLVIGADKPAALRQMKSRLHDIDSYLDMTGLVIEKRQIKSFPTWIVTDDKGEELTRVSSRLSASSLGEVNQILVNFLKL